MDYARFERYLLVVGAVVITGTLAAGYAATRPDSVEVVAQLLLFVVLAAAVHWGRRGGLIAAIGASGIYVVLRIPLIATGAPLSAAVLLMLLSRIAAYGVVGIGGGELCGRARYFLARMEDSRALDDWSRVFNQRHASDALMRARGRFTRYGEPYSVIVVAIAPALFADLQPTRQRTLVRGIADHLRADVRMVDEVCRLEDGRFAILLPHTPAEGGAIVASRIAGGVQSALGARPESVVVRCLAMPDGDAELTAFERAIAPADEDQEASGA